MTYDALERERRDLLETLAKHRGFLRHTVQGLTDDQARAQTTVSVLCLGGLIKHVSGVEARWARFAREGAEGLTRSRPGDWAAQFQMLEGETLAGLLDDYEAVERDTTELVTTAELDADHALPDAPWFEPGTRWSVRRVLLHVIAETAQHAGHADIIREALDGQKTMG